MAEASSYSGGDVRVVRLGANPNSISSRREDGSTGAISESSLFFFFFFFLRGVDGSGGM